MPGNRSWSLWGSARPRQAIDALPGEVVSWHRQEDLAAAVGEGGGVAEALATQMHVRKEAVEFGFGREDVARLHGVIVGARRNLELLLNDAQRVGLVARARWRR